MNWLLTLIVLAIAAYFLIRALRSRAPSGESERADLEHRREGEALGHDAGESAGHRPPERPLPGQRAATDGEVADAARADVGARIEGDAAELDREGAARAAEEHADTGGTGGAVLAGIAAAGAAADGAAAAGATDAREPTTAGATDTGAGDRGEASVASSPGAEATLAERELIEQGTPPRPPADDDRSLANPPDHESAGALDAARAEQEPRRERASADATGGVYAGADPASVSDAETPSGQSARDNARTNAPVADTAAGEAARDAVDVAEAHATRADAAPAATAAPEERANAPDAATAGGPLYRDRSVDARSNVAAGTATLVVGGATSSPTPPRRIDGGGGGAAAAGSNGGLDDAARLERVERRGRVREMMKILNLRDGDASRLGISPEDFGRLRRGDGEVPDALVDEVGARLRRMIG